MSESATSPRERARLLSTLQVVTLILSFYVLIALFVQSVMPLARETEDFLDDVDFFVCLVFLLDFFVRLYHAPSKLEFLKWGWIDFVSSIPMLEAFRVGRVVRIIRLFRILRAFRSIKTLVTFFLLKRKLTSIAAVATITAALLVFSSIAVLQFETSAEANIKSHEDALWWAYETITTVGYGDKFPVSTEGRVVACLLMTAGVGLFGTFSGFVSSLFIQPEIEREESDIQLLTREIQALRAQVQALEAKMDARREKG